MLLFKAPPHSHTHTPPPPLLDNTLLGSLLDITHTHAQPCICACIFPHLRPPLNIIFPPSGNWVAMGGVKLHPYHSHRGEAVMSMFKYPLGPSLRASAPLTGTSLLCMLFFSLFSTCKRRAGGGETIHHLTTDSPSVGLEGNGS